MEPAINSLRLVLFFGWVRRKDRELVCGNWGPGEQSGTLWPGWVSLGKPSWVLWTLVFTGPRGQSTEQPPSSAGLLTCSVKLVFINEQRRIRRCFKLIIYVADTLLQKGWVWVTDRPTCWNKAMLQLNRTMWLNSQISTHYAGWLIVRKKVGYLHKELVTALPESPAGSTLIALVTS